MNSKKVILLYTSKSKLINSNTEYLNELKKSNTFWLLVVTEHDFFGKFQNLGQTFKKFFE